MVAVGEPLVEVGGELAPVAELGERVGERLLAQQLMGDDVGGGLPCALDEVVHDGLLVVAKRATLAGHGERAVDPPGLAAEPERQRQRPYAVALQLARLLVGLRALRGGPQRRRQTRRACDLEDPRIERSAQREPSGVGVERLDRAAQDDVGERLEVELGRERVAEAAHRGLQAGALVRDQVEAALRLRDARVAVAGEQQQNAEQRKDQQDLGAVLARGVRDQQADRRDAGVDHPDQRDHADLHP